MLRDNIVQQVICFFTKYKYSNFYISTRCLKKIISQCKVSNTQFENNNNKNFNQNANFNVNFALDNINYKFCHLTK